MSKSLRAVIADDEQILRDHLVQRLSKLWPELTICGIAEKGTQALAIIKQQAPDIAFLDIRMPELSGLEVAQQVADYCQIVFVTAYDSYAVQAFEQQAIDYLVKPITDERLNKTIGRLQSMTENQQQTLPDLSNLIENLHTITKKKEYLRWLRASHQDTTRLIAVQDVIYFQSSDKYTSVMTIGNEFLIRKSLKNLADELDPDCFWQIHRSTIVNVAYITTIERSDDGRYQIKLKGRDETLLVSRSHADLFKQM